MVKGRERWASKIGFVLAASGSAVGLGNIWRFPYVTGEYGGAAFLIIYLIAIVLVGYPIMVTEIAIGRKAKKNPVGAFKALAPTTPWWLVGALSVLTGFVVLSYYSVIAGWSLAFMINSLGGFPEGIGVAASIFEVHTSKVLEPIIYHAIFMTLTVVIISAGVVKGIQRAVKFLMPVLTVLLILAVIRSVTLDGAGEGLAFLFRPDFGGVTAETILSAVGQAFFTLSLGMGAILTYGSYLSNKDAIPGSCVQIIGFDTVLAVIAGLAILPAVFALGFSPREGPGLVFVILPAVFGGMPLGTIFGFLFFLLLSIAALTSAISLLEVVVAYVIDEHYWPRGFAAVIIGIIIFIAGIPPILGYSAWDGVSFAGMNILDTYDFFAESIFLPLGGVLTTVFAGHVWGARNVIKEANRGNVSLKVGYWIAPLLKYIIPLGVIMVMIMTIIEDLD